MRKLRTLTDPAEIEQLLKDVHWDGPFDYKGREVNSSEPIAVPVKAARFAPGPLDKMYAEIRARERLQMEQDYRETDEEAEDFEVPEELEEFISRYEEQDAPALLGEALKDTRVQDALKAAIEGRYGEREASALAEMANERKKSSTIAPTAPSLAPPKAAADPPNGGEPPPPKVT